MSSPECLRQEIASLEAEVERLNYGGPTYEYWVRRVELDEKRRELLKAEER